VRETYEENVVGDEKVKYAYQELTQSEDTTSPHSQEEEHG
jgi:hypothetical protein